MNITTILFDLAALSGAAVAILAFVVSVRLLMDAGSNHPDNTHMQVTKNLLAVTRDVRNVFVAFLAVLFFAAADGVAIRGYYRLNACGILCRDLALRLVPSLVAVIVAACMCASRNNTNSTYRNLSEDVRTFVVGGIIADLVAVLVFTRVA